MGAAWGSVSAARESSLRAVINIAAAGDNTIVAAPGANFIIKIVKLLFVCTAAVAVTLKSGANNLTGAMSFSVNGGLGYDGDFTPLEMNANEAFIINLGGAVQVSGFVLYYAERTQEVVQEALP